MRCLPLVLSLLGLVTVATADTYYDTGGFEAYNYGPINGQGVTANVPAGWHDISTPPDNLVTVVDGPEPIWGKGIRFQVPNTQGATSAAEVVFANDLRQIAQTVQVKFWVYRERDAWNSNFWFFPNGTNPSYGLQWDQGTGVSKTLPLGFDGGGELTVMNTFIPMEIDYDFTGQFPVAKGYYNGDLLATVTYNDPNAPFTNFTGWTFSLQHDEATTNSDTEVLWVDNFRVLITIPEPAALLLLASGALLRRR